MILFVIGCIEANEVFELVEKNESAKKLVPQGNIKRIYPDEPSTIKQSSHTVNLDVVEPLFLMGFKDTDVGYNGSKLLKKEIIMGILLEIIFGRSSKLYEQLYEEGLIDDKFNFGYEGQKDYGFCTIGGQTPDPEKLYEKIQKCIAKIIEKGINPEDFDRVKKKFLGGFIQGFNSLEFIAGSFVLITIKTLIYLII